MTLIDRYLPRYQFHEHHSRPLAATPARAMAAVQAYRPEQDPFFRCAIALRELPVRAFNQLRAADPNASAVRPGRLHAARPRRRPGTGVWPDRPLLARRL